MKLFTTFPENAPVAINPDHIVKVEAGTTLGGQQVVLVSLLDGSEIVINERWERFIKQVRK